MSAGLAAAGLTAPVAQAAPSPQPSADRADELFALSAERGTLRPVRGRSGVFTLALKDPGRVVGFTDRPERRAASLSLRSFLSRWRSYGFVTVAPNAALEIQNARGSADVFVFSMRRPRYSRKARTVVFEVVHDRGQDLTGASLAQFERRADERIPQRFGRVSLFIDSAPNFGSRAYVRVTIVNGTEFFSEITAGTYGGAKSVVVEQPTGLLAPGATTIASVRALCGANETCGETNAFARFTGTFLGDDGTAVANWQADAFSPSFYFDSPTCKFTYTQGYFVSETGFDTSENNTNMTLTLKHVANTSHPTSRTC